MAASALDKAALARIRVFRMGSRTRAVPAAHAARAMLPWERDGFVSRLVAVQARDCAAEASSPPPHLRPLAESTRADDREAVLAI
jgi:hypothetical protein